MENYKFLDGFQLKCIAVICMFIDHLGHAVFNDMFVMRAIGRIAFPIFCFLLVEGYFHTKNIRKYILRLFIFMLVSEIPFDLALFGNIYDPMHQNVFVTLFIGLTTVYAVDFFMNKSIMFLAAIFAILGVEINEYIHADYGQFGIIIILLFYLAIRFKQEIYGYAGVVFYVLLKFSPVRVFTILALPFIYFYNGNRGKNIKYFFYLFYPVHLLFIAFVRLCLEGELKI